MFLRDWSVRPCVRPVDAAHGPLAIMPSAESGPDQEHAFQRRTGDCGFSRSPVSTGLSHYTLFALPNSVALTHLSSQAARNSGSLYFWPLVMMAQIIRAVLLASATAATFVVRRAISCTSHGRRVPCRSA